jgi:hypothetical protein
MPEKGPTFESPKDMNAERDREGEARFAEYPVLEVLQESPDVCAERIVEFEAMLTGFEQTYDLEALRAITQFASLEERRSSIRQPAREALTPLMAMLNNLEKQEAVSRELFRALQIRYRVLDRAVGTGISDPSGKIFDIIIHDR